MFIDHQAKDKWWIAFTNPTAGPWKKILSKDAAGQLIEIYRFAKEEDRPDLVLVSDTRKEIIIIEAKDYAAKLVGTVQMTKSAQVIIDMEKVLKKIDISAWVTRKDYKIIPGFLWYSASEDTTPDQVASVTTSFISITDTLDPTAESKDNQPINIVIHKTPEGLYPTIYRGVSPISIDLFKS